MEKILFASIGEIKQIAEVYLFIVLAIYYSVDSLVFYEKFLNKQLFVIIAW